MMGIVLEKRGKGPFEQAFNSQVFEQYCFNTVQICAEDLIIIVSVVLFC